MAEGSKKDHFVYQKNSSKSKEVVHRGTEETSKEWIKKNAKFYDHKGKDFVIYKGEYPNVKPRDAVVFDLKSIDEAKDDYKLMHKTFADATSEAHDLAKASGYEVDEDEWFKKVSTGSKKPASNKTNEYSVPLMKKGKSAKEALHFQIHNTGKAYELNVYIN